MAEGAREHPADSAASASADPPKNPQQSLRAKRTYPRTQNVLLGLLFTGDILTCLLGFTGSYYLRFYSPLRHIGPTPPLDISFERYLPLIITGTFFLIVSYTYAKLYDPRLLLRPLRSLELILRSTSLWFLLFLSLTFFLKIEPTISRFLTGISFVCTVMVIVSWRYCFHRWLMQSWWRERITQRLLFIGWSNEADHLAQTIVRDHRHAYSVCGLVRTNISQPIANGPFPVFESTADLSRKFNELLVDTVVLVDLELPREKVIEIAATCEKNYVEFKIIPSFFQIFISGLRMQTIAGVPILGVESLPLSNVFNRIIKRLMDIAGALVGLLFSVPIMGILAVLIKREDPGVVFYSQIRMGRHGHHFKIYKMRSMRPDAEKDSGPQWTVENDPRRLKIGAFMREWNLDELPQFWNILKGEMSLVGPRPERPELIEQFEKNIKNYHSRHEIRPGLTGWAQVNGLRGNTSLLARIRYDLSYIENWSLLLDLQILAFTFFRRKNAY